MSIGAAPRIAWLLAGAMRCLLRNRASRAFARGRKAAVRQQRQCVRVPVLVIGLSRWMQCGLWAKRCNRCDRRVEAKPLQVLEQCPFELRATARAIVVFDTQQHMTAMCPRDTPHMQRVDEMPEV